MTSDAPIIVDDLVVSFGVGNRAVQAVRNVSFTVARGESFGLVGESGSGKSTVLRVLSGLQRQWSGKITVAGRPLAPNMRERELARSVQMVFQDPYGSLHPRHTIDRALSEPLAIHAIPDIDNRVRSALERVGLPTRLRYRFPHQLSGGQRQRVAIARALMLEPPVLLLDEPTSALDVSVQAEVLNLLRQLQREHGLTYLLVSHNLAVVAYMCDRLIVMNRGQVVESLTADELRLQDPKHPYTRQLMKASIGYNREDARSLITYD